MHHVYCCQHGQPSGLDCQVLATRAASLPGTLLLLAAGTRTPTSALAIAGLALACLAALALALLATLLSGRFRHSFLLRLQSTGRSAVRSKERICGFSIRRPSLLALTTIATSRAFRAQVVLACVPGAVNANRRRGLSADAAGKGSCSGRGHYFLAVISWMTRSGASRWESGSTLRDISEHRSSRS